LHLAFPLRMLRSRYLQQEMRRPKCWCSSLAL
jgi:hypothetical protein